MKNLLSQLSIVGLFMFLLVVSAAAQSLRVEQIRVQLFLEHSGKLSDDLIRTKPTLWNTLAGEGEAGEPASSFLISIVVTGKESRNDAVVVRVTNSKSKKTLVSRRFTSLAWREDDRSQAVKAIFVEDRLCAPIRIVARTRSSQKIVDVPFECGE